MDCHYLLQRVFPTQRSNPGLLHGRQILYHLSNMHVLFLTLGYSSGQNRTDISSTVLQLTFKCVCVLVAQSCPTLCNPMDCSMPGSSVHGILQARILEWVASSFQEIFLTEGLNPSLLHCRQILYSLSHEGSPKIALRLLFNR